MYIMLLILNWLYYLRSILKSWLLIVYFMGLVIYFVLTLFCGYMAFELGRYVIATGDALPLIIVLLLALLSIHCIKQIYKAIKNKDLDILDWTGVPRGTIGRKVSGFMLGVGGVGLFCGRVHLQPRETKGNQGKPRKNQGNPRKNQGKPREQRKPLQSTKEIPSNQWEYLQSIGFLSKQG